MHPVLNHGWSLCGYVIKVHTCLSVTSDSVIQRAASLKQKDLARLNPFGKFDVTFAICIHSSMYP